MMADCKKRVSKKTNNKAQGLLCNRPDANENWLRRTIWLNAKKTKKRKWTNLNESRKVWGRNYREIMDVAWKHVCNRGTCFVLHPIFTDNIKTCKMHCRSMRNPMHPKLSSSHHRMPILPCIFSFFHYHHAKLGEKIWFFIIDVFPTPPPCDCLVIVSPFVIQQFPAPITEVQVKHVTSDFFKVFFKVASETTTALWVRE